MKSLSRFVLILALFLFSSAALVTAHARAEGKITLHFGTTWGGDDTRGHIFQASLKRWQEAHPNVEIIQEYTPGDEHRNKIQVQLAGGELPDVIHYWTGPSFQQPFIDANAVLDMSKYLAKSKTIKLSDWSESMLAPSYSNGVLYSFPVESFKCFTLYNTTLFDKYGQKPPVTYEDLLRVSKVFNDNGIVPLATGSKGGNPGHLFYNMIVYQIKDGMKDMMNFTGKKNPTVTTDSFLEAARIVNDMKTNKVFPDDTVANGDWGPSIVLYNQGKAAMEFSCPWMIERFEPEIVKASQLMHFPKVSGAVIDPATFNVGDPVFGVFINRASFEDTKKQDAIVDFTDYLLSDGLANELLAASVTPAKSIKVTNNDISPLYRKVLDFTATEKETYPVIIARLPTAGGLNAYSDAMDKLFAGEPPKDVLAQLQQEIDKEAAKVK